MLQRNPTDFFQGDRSDELWILSQIGARKQARADKNWKEADRVRDLLLEKGIALEDKGEDTQWRRL